MTKWMVAPSYSHAIVKTVDEDNHKALIEEVCDRCGGKGIVASRIENGHIIPIPVDGGICYKCNGQKKITKWVKAYTEKEYNSYIRSQEKAKEKKAQEAEARKTKAKQDSEINKKSLLEKFGYNLENPMVYIVTGGNTYSIKDQLKQAGAMYTTATGWYFSHEVEVPKGYSLLMVPFDKIFNWFPQTKRIVIKDEAKENIAAASPKIESLSEYEGEIKERLRNLETTFVQKYTFDGFYGTTNVFTFKHGENILTWMTSSCPEIEVGEKILLTGTVKKHQEYKGIKQTVLSRCIIKKEM